MSEIFNNDTMGITFAAMRDSQGHILVDGIDEWILKLLAVDFNWTVSDTKESPIFRMKDTKTGAVFEIRRVE